MSVCQLYICVCKGKQRGLKCIVVPEIRDLCGFLELSKIRVSCRWGIRPNLDEIKPREFNLVQCGIEYSKGIFFKYFKIFQNFSGDVIDYSFYLSNYYSNTASISSYLGRLLESESFQPIRICFSHSIHINLYQLTKPWPESNAKSISAKKKHRQTFSSTGSSKTPGALT